MDEFVDEVSSTYLVWKDRNTYADGEAYTRLPLDGDTKFTFCQWIGDGPKSKNRFWHIRPVNPATGVLPNAGALRPSQGGIDTKGLCGWPKPKLTAHSPYGGLDIPVAISEKHLLHSCEICARVFIKWLRTFEKPMPRAMAEAVDAANRFPDYSKKIAVEVGVHKGKYKLFPWTEDEKLAERRNRKPGWFEEYLVRYELAFTPFRIATGVPVLSCLDFKRQRPRRICGPVANQGIKK
jgi:hypothetical protein